MAKAEKKTETVVTTTVTLTISVQEAQFLRDVMNLISGDNERSRRKHADAIREALSYAGFTASGCPIPDVPGGSALQFRTI